MFDIQCRIIKQKVVKTRKEHICWFCERKINKGEKAISTTLELEYNFGTIYKCLECAEMIKNAIRKTI